MFRDVVAGRQVLTLMSQLEYSQDGTDRQTDTRPMLYGYGTTFCYECGRRTEGLKRRSILAMLPAAPSHNNLL